MPDKDVEEVVDEFVDDLDPIRVRNAAEQLGITIESFVNRIANELLARL